MIIKSDSEYSFEQKERLARRIQKIKKQKYLVDVVSIITKYNPELDITSNPSGQFMYFQDLTNDTYYALEKYLNKIIKSKTMTDTSDNTLSHSDTKKYSDNDDIFDNNYKLKYSNKERNIIKRKIYDHQVNSQNSDSEECTINDNDILDSQNEVEKNIVFVCKSINKLQISEPTL